MQQEMRSRRRGMSRTARKYCSTAPSSCGSETPLCCGCWPCRFKLSISQAAGRRQWRSRRSYALVQRVLALRSWVRTTWYLAPCRYCLEAAPCCRGRLPGRLGWRAQAADRAAQMHISLPVLLAGKAHRWPRHTCSETHYVIAVVSDYDKNHKYLQVDRRALEFLVFGHSMPRRSRESRRF